MANANAAATLKRAQDFGTDFANSVVTIRAGATVVATHTVPSWTATNSGSDALATAGSIGTATISGTGSQTATSAILTKDSKTYTLTLGVAGSGANIIVSTTNFIAGETSTFNSLIVTVRAS
jgi:ABC-type Zn uptake system ZnuABC Zn-binding protein ZnuA